LFDLYGHVLMLVPEPQAEDAGVGDDGAASGEGTAGAEGAAPGARAGRAGISGTVNTRAEAVRAIELVCAYLEQHEPTNPAQLFLRRARGLLERNFLELIKELAPDALDGVARIVGVDPESVGQAPE
jgi:type VI secretion system protein ImpA